MGFSKQEYWSGLPFPSPGGLPNSGNEPMSPAGHNLKNKGHSIVLKPPCVSSMDINGRWSSINKSESVGKLTQLCPTLCDPRTIQSMEFSRPEYWSGYPFPSPGDLPDPMIEPRSPALQADSLPAEPQWKPENTGVDSLSLLQRIFLTQEPNRGLLHCRQILYQLSQNMSLILEPRLVTDSLFPPTPHPARHTHTHTHTHTPSNKRVRGRTQGHLGCVGQRLKQYKELLFRSFCSRDFSLQLGSVSNPGGHVGGQAPGSSMGIGVGTPEKEASGEGASQLNRQGDSC